jgi:hypothetical protein
VSSPGIIVQRATYALTHRCAFRKLFLTPLTPMLHGGILYLLAHAARECAVEVHHITVMPNHIHLTVSTTLANLPRFKEMFFGEVSKLVKTFLAVHDFEPPEKVLCAGEGHHMRLIGAGAQLAWLHYEDVNTIDAGLVERVEDYPGLSTDLGLMNGGVLVAKRPPIYCDRRTRDAEILLPFSAPADAVLAFDSSRPFVHHLEKLRDTREKALARQRKRPVIGALGVTRMHPWSEPRSPRQLRSGPTPSFMVVGDPELEHRCALEVTEQRTRYDEALAAYQRGERALFPYGTYKMRVEHGVEVEPVEATEGRVVNRPGPLELPRMGRDKRRSLQAELRAEAEQVAQHVLDDNLAARLEEARNDQVDRRDAPSVSVAVAAGAPEPRKVVVLRGSTARARRRHAQQARQRAARDQVDRGESHFDADDVEPPFD